MKNAPTKSSVKRQSLKGKKSGDLGLTARKKNQKELAMPNNRCFPNKIVVEVDRLVKAKQHKFLEEWEGQGVSLPTFVVWDGLTGPKKNALLKNERNAMCFQILASTDNTLSTELIERVELFVEKKKEEKRKAREEKKKAGKKP